MKMKIHIATAAAMLVLGGASGLCYSTQAAGAATASVTPDDETVTSTSTVDGPDGGYISTTDYASGDSVQVYADVPYTVSVTDATDSVTPPGSSSPVTETNRSMEFDPTSDDTDQVSDSSPTATQELTDMGDDPADVAQYQDFDASTPQSSTCSSPQNNGCPPGNDSTKATVHPDTSPSQLVGPVKCIRATGAKGHVIVTGCDEMYQVYAKGSDKYEEEKFQSLIHSTCHSSGCIGHVDPEPSGLAFGDSFSNHKTNIYEVDPASTVPENCSERTASVTAYGVGLSEDGEVCDSTWGPWNAALYRYMAKWDGQGNGVLPNVYRATHGVMAINSPGTSRLRSVIDQFWWVSGANDE